MDSRSIAVSMRKSVENLVISSQDAIGQSISQALNFSGVINAHVLQETSSSRSPSPAPAPRNQLELPYGAENIDVDKLEGSQGTGDWSQCVVGDGIVVPQRITDKFTPPKSSASVRSKKKAWYSVLYPTYKSRSEDFKRLFKDVPDDERLIVDYSCALQKDILAQGRLYVSQNYLCFYANIFGWETNLVIRWKDVTAITKEKTALVIPNAILVCVDNEKHFLASLTRRDTTYLMLFRIWQNALMDQPVTRHEIYQWVHSCYGAELGFDSDDEGHFRELDEEKIPPEDLAETSSMETGGGESREDVSAKLFSMVGDIALASEAPVTNGVQYRDSALGDTVPTDVTDSSDSEPDKHNSGGAIEKCTCPHDGKLMLEQQLAINIDQLFTYIFTNSKLFLELMAARNARDFVQAAWQDNNDSGLKSRQISYTLSLSSGPIGPKEVYVTETQVMNKCTKPGVLYSIDVSGDNAGIPYADYFAVETHYCLQSLAENSTNIQVYGQVKYKKSLWPMVKSFLEKNAMSGLEEYCKLLESVLVAEEGGVTSKRKGRRRRRAASSTIETPISVVKIPNLVARNSIAQPRDSNSRPSGWLLGIFTLLLLINAILYWRLYYVDRGGHVYDIDDLHSRMSSLSDSQMSGWSKMLEEHSAKQQSQLLAWREALATAVKHLQQTEQSLKTLLESIQPSLDKVQKEATDNHREL